MEIHPIITDHGVLTGLSDDDHSIYWVDTTIDTRTKNYTTTGTLASGVHTITSSTLPLLSLVNTTDTDTEGHFNVGDLGNFAMVSTDGKISLFPKAGDDVVINSTGSLRCFSDGQWTLGEITNFRPSNIWATTNITAGVDIVAEGNVTAVNYIRAGQQFIARSGTVSAPSFSFEDIGNNEDQTGMYLISFAPAVLGFTTDGVFRMAISDTAVTIIGNIDLTSDSNKLQLGADQDFLIYSDGSDSYIESITGELKSTTADGADGTSGGGTAAEHIRSTSGQGGDATGGDTFNLAATGGYFIQTAGDAGVNNCTDAIIGLAIFNIGGSFLQNAGAGGLSTGGGSGSGAQTGGAGGIFQLTAGNGGVATGSSGACVGGAGGTLDITAGAGGTASGSGANTHGVGGDVNIKPGGGPGTAGVITLGDGGGTTYMQIEVDGDTYWVGAGSGLAYGGMFLHNGGVTIDCVGGNFVKITGLGSVGLLNNVTYSTSALRADKVGVYKVSWECDADAAAANKDFEFAIYLNEVEVQQGSSHTHSAPTAGDEFSVSGTALIDVTSTAHDIDLRVKNITDDTDIDILDVSFNIIQVGGT